MEHYDPTNEEIDRKFNECGRDPRRFFRLIVVETAAHYHAQNPAIIENTNSNHFDLATYSD